MRAGGDAIAESFGVPLGEAGFVAGRGRRWVRERTPPLRDLFEIQALKGARCSARWGFAVDFVPAFANGRFRWKRTTKTVEFDLCIDPIDEAGDVPGWCSFAADASSAAASPREAARAAAATLKAAFADFARVGSLADLAALFERRGQLRYRRFSPDNYVQTHLAWGLVLHAIGRAEEGERHVARFVADYSAPADDPILAEALAAAERARVAA